MSHSMFNHRPRFNDCGPIESIPCLHFTASNQLQFCSKLSKPGNHSFVQRFIRIAGSLCCSTGRPPILTPIFIDGSSRDFLGVVFQSTTLNGAVFDVFKSPLNFLCPLRHFKPHDGPLRIEKDPTGQRQAGWFFLDFSGKGEVRFRSFDLGTGRWIFAGIRSCVP